MEWLAIVLIAALVFAALVQLRITIRQLRDLRERVRQQDDDLETQSHRVDDLSRQLAEQTREWKRMLWVHQPGYDDTVH